MLCPNCGSKLIADFESTGGCMGHGSDEYCYCDSFDVTIKMVCLAGSVRDGSTKFPNKKCRGFSKKVITDKYALERYFTENYKETD